MIKKRFDAKKYWATKPFCNICKSHKVKSGNICYKCKHEIMNQNKTQKRSDGRVISNDTDDEIKIIQQENNPNNINDFGINISSETQNKIVRLFTYMEKALALDDSIIRDFRPSIIGPSPWWLSDYPRDLESLFIRQFDTEKDHENIDQSGAWLRVQKKNIEPAPSLPEALVEWIIDINPIDVPKTLEKIDRKVRFDDDSDRLTEFNNFRKNFKQGDEPSEILKEWVILSKDRLPEAVEIKYVTDNWIDHPELEKVLVGYIENEWKPWSEIVKKQYKVNLLYDQLYALRLLLKNEGDNYELLIGHGLLTWKHSSVGSIYAPIFFSPLVLDFDAAKRTIEINPDPMFRSFVEITPISEMDNPAEVDLDRWMGIINSDPFDFWHLETLKSQVSVFLNYLSPNSEDRFTDQIVTAPTITENPSVWNAPLIFVRKRTNSLWSKYAEIIKRDVEQNGSKSSEFINDLVGEYDEKNISPEVDCGARETTKIMNDAELFFPLPWNDEQKRIAELIESNYGVVVKGPPGTGKSHTIANLISRFLAQGKSVLVTSQTSKALEVLRGKLPENIRSLAVSQLHQTARRDNILQQSIAEISSNLGERHTKFSETREEFIRNELSNVREEKALVANLIRQYILTDSTQTIRIGGSDITPINAAKFISEHDSNQSLFWFIDNINFDNEINFSMEDLKEAHRLLVSLSEDDRDLYKYNLPEVSSLPNEDVVLGAFIKYKELSAKTKGGVMAIMIPCPFCKEAIAEGSKICPICKRVIVEIINSDKSAENGEEKNSGIVNLLDLSEELDNASKILNAVNDDYEFEIFESCVASQNERERWNIILSKIYQKIQIIEKSKKDIIGHNVSSLDFLELNDLADAIQELKSKIKNTKIGALAKIFLSSNAKKVIDVCRVDGRLPDNFDRIEILDNLVSAQIAENEIILLLNQGFSCLNNQVDFSNDDLSMIELRILIENLHHIVNYCDNFIQIDEAFKKVKQLSKLSFIKVKDIDAARELIASSVAQFELLKLESTFNEWKKNIDELIDSRHVIHEKFIQAIDKKNNTAWRKAIEELSLLIKNKEYSVMLNEVSGKIIKYAPKLYQDIVESANHKQKFDYPDNLELVWKISRLRSWLDHIHNHVSIDELQNKHERLSKKEFQLNSDLVTILAWQRQIDKVTKKQRDALMAWSDSMRKLGKGTGKYAHKHLAAAQESLKEAKNAVPVWIMPLHRAAQMFSDPKAGMFDVVIFDEASQCDIRGLTIGYLGKKLLVVGDPDQISPAGIFQDQERIYELISRFLYDIPHKDNFSITSSLFDLAQIRIPNIIQLNEHFRCVPEIIAFSNYHIYEGKLKPLRYPHPRGLLVPPLVPVFVENGYQNTNNKVNEPEAKAIVEKILECLGDPNYQQRPDGRICTFGVISLLAEDQAKYIKELLLKHPQIGERVIEERNIVCGDSYAFQGDERDVIFLSMVKALDPNNPNDTVRAIVDKNTSQRFNVAATRGRDQVFLYHSIPLEEFRNQDDWRFKILNWYYNPKTEELEAGRKAMKREFDSGRASQFSFDVGNILIDRGYQVLPEYPVIGYRIDLVIQGENARLAVECDGDQYHTLENWEEDQIRERQLRRAGWEFWRVSGSSFYRYKEMALDSLWKRLDELGIKPIVK